MHSIAFNRGLFDAEHFKDSTRFGGAKVKELQPETASARRVIAMLEKGVFAAIKAKYAKSITFYIADPEPGACGEEVILEEYVFNVRYGEHPDDPEVDLEGPGVDKRKLRHLDDERAIKDAANAMIRNLCSIMATLDPAPEGRAFGVKLSYFDHVPAEYEPPFFEAADPRATRFLDPAADPEHHDRPEPVECFVGRVETRHHRMNLSMRSVLAHEEVDARRRAGDEGPASPEDGEKNGRRTKPDAAERGGGGSKPPRRETSAERKPPPSSATESKRPVSPVPECSGPGSATPPPAPPRTLPSSSPSPPPLFDEMDYHYDSQPSMGPASPAPLATFDASVIRDRVVGWIASRAPGSRVDAVGAAGAFPEVPFKVLDQALLDLSRAGALRTPGDGTFSLASSSQGLARAAVRVSFGAEVRGGGSAPDDFGALDPYGECRSPPPAPPKPSSSSPFGRVGSASSKKSFSFGGGSRGASECRGDDSRSLGAAPFGGRAGVVTAGVLACSPVISDASTRVAPRDPRRGLEDFEAFERRRAAAAATARSDAPAREGLGEPSWKARLRSSQMCA